MCSYAVAHCIHILIIDFTSFLVRWRNLRNYTFPFECAAATEKAKWEANAEEDVKYAAKNSFTESFVWRESL